MSTQLSNYDSKVDVLNIRGVPIPRMYWELLEENEKAATQAKQEYGYSSSPIQADDYCYALRNASRDDIEQLADKLERAANELREVASYGYYD